MLKNYDDIEGMIFDADGTIFESTGVWETAEEDFVKSLGKEPKPGLSKILFEMSLDEGAVYIKKEYDLSLKPSEILSGILKNVEEAYLKKINLKEGAEEFLVAIYEAGIPACIASSSNRSHIEGALKRLGIAKCFKKIFTCSEVGKSKNDPLIFEIALNELGTKKDKTIIFEDGLYSIKTAKKAGFLTAGVYDDFSKEDWEEVQEITDISFRDFKEIKYK